MEINILNRVFIDEVNFDDFGNELDRRGGENKFLISGWIIKLICKYVRCL